jgi:hypothetical protein
MTRRELVLRLSSKTKRTLGLVALIAGVMASVLIGAWSPVWLLVLLASIALALLYIIARLRSRYDPLDPRFGSCVPPINMPRTDNNSRPDAADQQFDA